MIGKRMKGWLLSFAMLICCFTMSACDVKGLLSNVFQSAEESSSVESSLESSSPEESSSESSFDSSSSEESSSEEVDSSSEDSSSEDAVCQHTGGTASCTTLAVCQLCGESYGELGAHAS